VPDGKGGDIKRCATAGELHHGNVPGWRKLKPGETALPGDIRSGRILDPGVGATGHTTILISDGKGGVVTIGAHHDRVGPPGVDNISDPVTSRYTGD